MKYLYAILVIFAFIKCYPQINDFEGNNYDTIKIGNQVWLNQNLRSKFYSDGTSVSESIFIYNNDKTLLNENGYLYSYKALTRGSTILPIQGICPNNYHVPEIIEWMKLIETIGGKPIGPKNYTGGDSLKDDIRWNGINIYGFSIFPSGARNANGFMGLNTRAWIWSSIGDVLYFTEGYAINRYSLIYPTTEDAMSCRCIKNGTIGIKEKDGINYDILIYPNPTNENIKIFTNTTLQNSQIFIYNSLGATVVNIPFETELNISQLASGLYIMAIKTPDNKQYTAKFIKQ
jgi:uncharacterized protein (TIGR02145 family)